MQLKNKITFPLVLISISVICLGVLFFDKIPPTSGNAVLSWNANTEPDLAGYKIYYGTTPRNDDCPRGGYEKVVDARKETDYKIENLKFEETYYFSVTSYNSAGKESCFSEEMKKETGTPIVNKIKKIFNK